MVAYLGGLFFTLYPYCKSYDDHKQLLKVYIFDHYTILRVPNDMKARQRMLTIDRVKIGNNLKRWREYRLITQQELADAAGLGVASVVRIENNRTEPRFRTIKKLADALNLEPEQLLGERPPERLNEE